MTVDARYLTMVDAAQTGGDRYILKPVNAVTLRQHLEHLLGPCPAPGRSAVSRHPILAVGA